MKLKAGQVVAVTFHDHVEDGRKPALLVCYGRLERVGHKALVLQSWAYADPAVKPDANVKRFALVRAAVVEVKVLG